MSQSGQRSATKLRLRRALAGACLALIGAAPASAQPTSPSLQPFTIVVPRDYAKPAAGSLQLRVAVARALRPQPGAEPIFVVEALGESGVDAAGRGLIDSLQALRDRHDLVFIDQRGTSLSPLLCPPVDPHATLAEQAAPIFDPMFLEKCRRAFDSHENLGDLNSRTFAQDLESVRRKLGYKRIELIGYFYGTRVVQRYLERWPDRASAAVLADMSPLDYPAAEAEAGALSASVASTLRACSADKACAEHYPDLGSEWTRVVALLSAPGSDGGGTLYWMELRTLRWASAASWPRDVDAIANGQLASAVQQYAAYRRVLLASYPLALRVAVDCAENLSARQATGAAAAEQSECAKWAVHRLAPGLPRIKVPVLAITGEFDIEAPASAVRRAVARFANAQLVVFANRARATDVDWSECMGPLVTAFLQSSGRAKPDTSCTDRLKRPPFAIASAP